MKNNPVSRIAIFGFVNPVVNVLLSALINGCLLYTSIPAGRELFCDTATTERKNHPP